MSGGDDDRSGEDLRDGTEVFIDEPAMDASTGVFAVQLSRLVRDAHGKKVGALTLTLKIPRSALGR